MENGIVKNATIETMAVDIAISTQSGITSLMYGLGNQLIKSFGEGGAIGNSFKYSRYALGGVGIGVGAGIGIYNTIDVANKYGVNSNEFYESALFTSADLYIGVTAMLINPVLGVGITAIYLYGKYQYRGYYQSPEFFGNKYKYSFPKKGGN